MTGAENVVVLDASALLGRSVISTVNWAEVLERYRSAGLTPDGKRESVEGIDVGIEAFASDDAEAVAALWAPTRPAGLSIADRACLALAQRLEAPAYSTDRAWRSLGVGPSVVLIR